MRNTVWIFVRVLACAPANESRISATAKGNRKKRGGGFSTTITSQQAACGQSFICRMPPE
jgi:hypothetical protein